MLKWLSNPKYYYINKYYNNGNVNFVKSLEYARYEMCKSHGRMDSCNSLEIDYYKSGYRKIIVSMCNEFSEL